MGLLGDLIPGWSRTILEGVLKITLFVLYLAVVSRSKDMHRMFQYHGAEHKTIACYEAGEELTPENVKKYTRFHPRCGTSFLLIVLVVSVLVLSLIHIFTTQRMSELYPLFATSLLSLVKNAESAVTGSVPGDR